MPAVKRNLPTPEEAAADHPSCSTERQVLLSPIPLVDYSGADPGSIVLPSMTVAQLCGLLQMPYLQELVRAVIPTIGNPRALWEDQKLSLFDMVELQFRIVGGDHSFLRILGVNAGITLFNLHRAFCTSLGFPEDAFEQPFHYWHFPGAPVIYANGTDFKRHSKSLGNVATDKTAVLNSFIGPNSTSFYYDLDDARFEVRVTDVIAQQTVQADLVWVPRVTEGSVGEAPLLLGQEPDDFIIDRVNLMLNEGRFGRNMATSRRTKRKRTENLDMDDKLRLLRQPISQFFQHRTDYKKRKSPGSPDCKTATSDGEA
ncbi:MAG: hypothetical protein KVP17_003642 [Porospora cf. gigantea B]|uniref:uncharacterized protein n=1 Tax=Porospora cf. gigantea B TaxID=2853592 RepID=UPI003571AD51|nr:MAG: hypothetical protein KVP17_003642 [Porospora cf. gigantea B]